MRVNKAFMFTNFALTVLLFIFGVISFFNNRANERGRREFNSKPVRYGDYVSKRQWISWVTTGIALVYAVTSDLEPWAQSLSDLSEEEDEAIPVDEEEDEEEEEVELDETPTKWMRALDWTRYGLTAVTYFYAISLGQYALFGEARFVSSSVRDTITRYAKQYGIAFAMTLAWLIVQGIHRSKYVPAESRFGVHGTLLVSKVIAILCLFYLKGLKPMGQRAKKKIEEMKEDRERKNLLNRSTEADSFAEEAWASTRARNANLRRRSSVWEGGDPVSSKLFR